MTTTAQPEVGRSTGTRISSYLLVEYLERIGVDVIFGLCGHTNIAFLDALSKSRIRFLTSRHEQVSAHSADGYARVTGKPGVVLSHLGPGLTNCATGVANAALDSIPMVVIAGDIPSYYYGRHPHQEMNLHQDADQSQIYRPFCKRVYRVDRAADLPADHGTGVSSGHQRPAGAGAGRHPDGRSSPPTFRPTRSSRCPRKLPARHSTPRPLNESSPCSPKRTGR